MSADLHRVKAVFLEAVEKHGADQWAAYLTEACGDDEELRHDVEALLDAHASEESLLDKGALAGSATTYEPITEKPGTEIGPYKLLELIGEGGFGMVYLAEQTKPIQRRVALKIIKPGMDTKQVIARFEAERQALALMDHPNIAHVLDAGATASGRPYFVMELVAGVPITAYCDERNLTTVERLELFVSVCQAVQHAHQKGIIHRDIKPTNVLVASSRSALSEEGGTGCFAAPKIIDFGVAKAINQRVTEQTFLTGAAQMLGTPLYMSPEQAERSALEVDTRADIYSLGVLLYELLTSTTPFERSRLSEAGYDELRRIIREEEPPKPSLRISTLGERARSVAEHRRSDPRRLSQAMRGELDWIVMKCLEKDRSRRYETASELARDVERYLHDEPVLASPPSAWYRLRKFARRNKGVALAAGLILLALVVREGVYSLPRAVALAAGLLLLASIGAIVGTTLGLIQSERARSKEAQQRQRAEANLRKALDAVNDYLSRVSTEMLLQVPTLEPLRKQLLDHAVRYYQDFVREHGANPELQAEIAAAYLRIAMISHDLGPEHDPFPAFQRGFEMVAELLRKKPNISAFRSLKAGVFLVNTSTTLHTRRPDEALRIFEKACPVWEQLVREDPSAPGFQNDLALIHLVIGILKAHFGQPEQAVRSWDRATELWGKLSVSSPNVSHYQATWACTLGDSLLGRASLGQLSEADEAAQQAIETAEKLTQDYPGVPAWRDLLAGIYERYASMLEQVGRLGEAEQACRHMLAGQEGLRQNYPEVCRYQMAVFRARLRLGQLLWATGRHDEAVEHFGEVRALGEKLSPDDPEAQNLLAWFLATSPDRRFQDPCRAVEVAKILVEQVPEVGDYWTTLGAAHYGSGDYEAAVPALEQGLAIVNRHGSSARFLLAMAHWQLGQKDEARRRYVEAAAYRAKHPLAYVDTRRFYADAEELIGPNKPEAESQKIGAEG